MTASAVGKVDHYRSGWKFEGLRDPTYGFYLKDLSHDGFYFAESIRLARIGVAGFTDGGGYRSRDDIANHHVFTLADCKETLEPTVEFIKDSKVTDPLGHYAPKLKIITKYEMKNLVYETDQKMELELAYLFTAYGKDPSHEPGGLISAARVYPTLTFKVLSVNHKKKKRDYRRATAVQAIFRLHFKLDDNGPGNQCGVFADLDDLDLVGTLGNMAAKKLPGAMTFERAEKPVPYDLVGRGLNRGKSEGWNNDVGWDNIHQWSHPTVKGQDAPDDGLKNQVYTPGLPYGAHVHWRWSRDAVAGAFGLPGGDQFGGPQGAGMPLVDDRIRDQNIEFAIVDGDSWLQSPNEANLFKHLDQDPVTYMFRDFSDVFTSQFSCEVALPSSDPLIFLSITAWDKGFDMSDLPYREWFPGSGTTGRKSKHPIEYALDEWGGTMFAHGIFFPHQDIDVLGTKLRLVPGIHKMQYLPKTPTQVWRR